jgi:hypothetical protein
MQQAVQATAFVITLISPSLALAQASAVSPPTEQEQRYYECVIRNAYRIANVPDSGGLYNILLKVCHAKPDFKG